MSVDSQDGRRPRKVARIDRQDDVTEQERSSYSNSSSRHRGYSISSEREESRNKTFRVRKHRKKRRQLGTCEQRGWSDAHLDRNLRSTSLKISEGRIVPEQSLPRGDYRPQGRQTAPDRHEQQVTIPRPLADLIEQGKGISLYDVLKVIPLGTQQLAHLLSGVLGQPEMPVEDTERRQLSEQSGHVECERSEGDGESTFCDKCDVESEHMDSQQMRMLHFGTCEQQGMGYIAAETQHAQNQQISPQQGPYVSSDGYDQQYEQHPLERQPEESQQSSLYDKLQIMSYAKDDQKGRSLPSDSYDHQYRHQPPERQPDSSQQSSLYDKLQLMPKVEDYQHGRGLLSDSHDQQCHHQPPDRQPDSSQQSSLYDKLQMMPKVEDYQHGRGLLSDSHDQQCHHQPPDRQPDSSQQSSLYDKLQGMSSRDCQQGRRFQSHEFGQEGRLPTSVEGLQGKQIPLDNGLGQELPPGNMRELHVLGMQSNDFGQEVILPTSIEGLQGREILLDNGLGQELPPGNMRELHVLGMQSNDFGQEVILPTSIEGLQGREIPLDNGLGQELPPGNMRELHVLGMQSNDFGQEGILPTSVEGLQGRKIPLDNGLGQELPPGNTREHHGPGVTHWGKQQRLMPGDTDGQHSQGVMSGNMPFRFNFPLASVASTGSCQQFPVSESRQLAAGSAEDDSVIQEQENKSRPTTTPAPTFPPPGILQKSASEPEKTDKTFCTVSDVII